MKYYLISQEEVEKLGNPYKSVVEQSIENFQWQGANAMLKLLLSKAKLVDSDESVKVEIGYPSPKVSDFIVQPKEPQWLDKPDSEGWWWFKWNEPANWSPEPRLVKSSTSGLCVESYTDDDECGLCECRFIQIASFVGKWLKLLPPSEVK